MKNIDKITETKKAGKLKKLVLNPMLAASMVLAPVAATLPFAACSDDPTPTEENQQQVYTIPAFGKTITVINNTGGDISDAVAKLRDVWDRLETTVTADPGLGIVNTVLDRGLEIVVNQGNVVAKEGNNTINVGVDYLSATNYVAIANGLGDIIYDLSSILTKAKSLNNAWVVAKVERFKALDKAIKSKARS
jgi:hypothetical protein